jgi:hypothetical protein
MMCAAGGALLRWQAGPSAPKPACTEPRYRGAGAAFAAQVTARGQKQRLPQPEGRRRFRQATGTVTPGQSVGIPGQRPLHSCPQVHYTDLRDAAGAEGLVLVASETARRGFAGETD